LFYYKLSSPHSIFVSMKSILLLTFVAALSITSPAQTSDMLIFKNNGKTIKTFMKGSSISFITTDGNWYSGRLEEIRNDSLFFREIIIRQVPTQWGTPRLDTTTSLLHRMHFTDIAGMPRGKETFSFIRNGSLLMIGSAGYVALNLINAAYLRYAPFDNDNRDNLVAAAGIFGAGYLMHKLRKPLLIVGKKYTLHYVSLRL
jgi:hypothetical protein